MLGRPRKNQEIGSIVGGQVARISRRFCQDFVFLFKPKETLRGNRLWAGNYSSFNPALRVIYHDTIVVKSLIRQAFESMARSCVTKSELVYCIILILTVQAHGTLHGWIEVIGSSPWTVVLHPETTKAKSTVSIYFPPQLSVSADNVKNTNSD